MKEEISNKNSQCNFEDFKRFYLLFRKGAFVKTDGITCFLDGFVA